MTSIVKQKWELNRRKNEKARELESYSLSEARHEKPVKAISQPVAAYAYADGYLYVSDDAIWQYPDRLWQLLEQLKEWVNLHHPEYWQEVQALMEQDTEAARQARIAKIMGAIGNNMDDLPELKDEIIKLGDMLKKGEDIKSYCQNYDSPDSGSS